MFSAVSLRPSDRGPGQQQCVWGKRRGRESVAGLGENRRGIRRRCKEGGAGYISVGRGTSAWAGALEDCADRGPLRVPERQDAHERGEGCSTLPFFSDEGGCQSDADRSRYSNIVAREPISSMEDRRRSFFSL